MNTNSQRWTFNEDLINMCNDAIATINKLKSYKNETKFYTQLVCVSNVAATGYKISSKPKAGTIVKFCELFFKRHYVKYNRQSTKQFYTNSINTKLFVPSCQNIHMFSNATDISNYYDTKRKNYVKVDMNNLLNVLLYKLQSNFSAVTILVNNNYVYFAENKYVYHDVQLSNVVMQNGYALKWYTTNCRYNHIDLQELTLSNSICNCGKILN